MKNLIVGILVGAAATALGLWAFDREESADESTSPRVSLDDAAQPIAPVSDAFARVDSTVPPSAAGSPPTTTMNAAPHTGTAAGPAMSSQSAPTLDIPGGVLDEAAADPLAPLLETFRIDCQYGPGHGGRWPDGTLVPHAASWQGGPITFDIVDLDAGTARLRASSGLTRTLDGELEVRAHATDTGLHFTVFAPGGELIVATVYAARDAQGRQLGVVSFHGPRLQHESAQFYGTCTLA